MTFIIPYILHEPSGEIGVAAATLEQLDVYL
jgi:hypothetical protein